MDKNINALGNGTDTIRNSGTGTLTLAGTLTKNGTVLTLQAATAKINVTGPIVGALPNSDLNVTGNQTTTVANNNTYNGATVVGTGNAGENSTLAVTGSLSGTTAVTVNSGSVLLLNSSATTLPAASNIVKASATFTTSAGAGTNAGDARLTVGNTTPGITNTFGQMTLNANTTVDFGAGSNNSRLQFANLEGGGTVQSGTALALFNGTTKLTINNWTGATYPLGATSDPGVAAGPPYDTQDRLLFNSDPGFALGVPIAGIDFTGLGAGIEVSFGSQFEIVPVPEPAANVLIGSVALCALIGYRHRRRATGIRGGVWRG